MNSLNLFMGSLLSAVEAGQGAYETISTEALAVVNTYVIPALMTVATVVLVVCGIITGIQLAKASTDEEKTKAKKRLIGIGAGAVVCAVSIWVIPLLVELLTKVFVFRDIAPYS